MKTLPREMEAERHRGRSLEGLRYELRCVADQTQHGGVLNWIGTHPMAFKPAYPDRVVNNIYFDTYHFNCFGQNLAGVSERKKFRFRWYGNTFSPEGGAFEIKERYNLLGGKQRYSVALSRELSQLTLKQVRAEILQQLPDRAAEEFRAVSEAVLINRYIRQYFQSADLRVRITVDRDLSFYDQRFQRRPRTRFRSEGPGIVILESKFAANDGDEVRRRLGGLPGRMSRCSKYMMGLQRLLGY